MKRLLVLLLVLAGCSEVDVCWDFSLTCEKNLTLNGKPQE